MAKRGRPSKAKLAESTPKLLDGQEFSWDLDSRLLIAGVWYNIETAIKEAALEKVGDQKMAIPKSVVLSTIKELGLKKWLKGIDTGEWE